MTFFLVFLVAKNSSDCYRLITAVRFCTTWRLSSNIRKEIRVQTSRVLALLQSEPRNCGLCVVCKVNSPLWKRVIAWVESSCPSDCGKVWGDVGHRIQRPPKQSHNPLVSYSRPRPSLIFQSGLQWSYAIGGSMVMHVWNKNKLIEWNPWGLKVIDRYIWKMNFCS